jgi:predicted alpha-1,6-mannanase (GH76 family)
LTRLVSWAESDLKHVFKFFFTQQKQQDVKLQFYKNDPKEKKEKLNRVFHAWFNTHFIEDNHLTLVLDDIDGIKKTKKDFPSAFAVEFIFEDVKE